MAPRIIRRQAPNHAKVDGISQPVREGINRKVHLKLAQMHRRIIGPRAYTMNVVERFLLPRHEDMGIQSRRTQCANVLQGYLRMMRRIDQNLCETQALHHNAHSDLALSQQYSPLTNVGVPDEDLLTHLQDTNEGSPHSTLVDIYVDTTPMVVPKIVVHREEDDVEDVAVNDVEDAVVNDDAIAPLEHGYVSPLFSPSDFSNEGYGHTIMSPEIGQCNYDCPLCLSMQVSPTDSNFDLDEAQDYEPILFR